MQKKDTSKPNASSSKFDSAFEKMSSMLTKEYKDQFKKVEYAGNSKKEKVKDSLRKGNAVIVTKKTDNKHEKQIDLKKALDPEVEYKQKEVPKEISNQVQIARTNAKLSQDQLAKLVEVKPHIIKDLEAGEGAYDASVVAKIEATLKVKFERNWKKTEK